jgi:hypothetical protein
MGRPGATISSGISAIRNNKGGLGGHGPWDQASRLCFLPLNSPFNPIKPGEQASCLFLHRLEARAPALYKGLGERLWERGQGAATRGSLPKTIYRYP